MRLGGETLVSPHNKGKTLVQSIFLSREAYETLLRRLVKKYRSNVRFIAGLASGLKMSSGEPNFVDGVLVKTNGKRTLELTASLVIGTCICNTAGSLQLNAPALRCDGLYTSWVS